MKDLMNTTTMTSQEIARLVESRHDKVKQSVKRLAKGGTIRLPPMGEVEDNQSLSPNNRTAVYIFTGEQGKRDSIVVVAQLSPEFTARLVDRWQELERRSGTLAIPNFSDPAAAARAWAEQYEARREAERTKAWIGERREATAMATASSAVRQMRKLEIELGRSMDYCTIKRMTMICHGQAFDWRLLKAVSKALGLEPQDVFDANYGTVKAYHREAWREAYGIDLEEVSAA